MIISGTLLLSLSGFVYAGDSTLDAAIGGGVGGAIGGAVGAEVGGRDGAIIGSAIGAAAGTAVTTKDNKSEHHKHRDTPIRVDVGRSSRFCPPGQAMKGRC
ncbi:MAG: hypothetical protein EP334_05320 [Gammaproteobacteria bacterium]|nr:MAG: hypothetical protein EP334_05320 [Gammaproteobacteria bacterium]